MKILIYVGYISENAILLKFLLFYQINPKFNFTAGFKCYYNIPRACLFNRSPVPAMDLKSNRSSLWRHMLETCRMLGRLCRKHSNNVARHDKTPVKSTLSSRDKNILSRDMSLMSRRSDIMLWLHSSSLWSLVFLKSSKIIFLTGSVKNSRFKSFKKTSC